MWSTIPGRLKQVDVSGENFAWGVNSKGDIWLRAGLRARWKLISKNKNWTHVSVGGAGVWGVEKNGCVYYLKGVSSNKPEGTEWIKIDGTTLNLTIFSQKLYIYIYHF